MIGMVLAAGAGKRLGEDTRELPKTLLPVDGSVTIPIAKSIAKSKPVADSRSKLDDSIQRADLFDN